MRVLTLSFIAALLAFVTLGGAPARAAETVCKGLANDACTGNAACSWVKGYKTKKGRETAGFCRKKASRKAKQG